MPPIRVERGGQRVACGERHDAGRGGVCPRALALHHRQTRRRPIGHPARDCEGRRGHRVREHHAPRPRRWGRHPHDAGAARQRRPVGGSPCRATARGRRGWPDDADVGRTMEATLAHVTLFHGGAGSRRRSRGARVMACPVCLNVEQGRDLSRPRHEKCAFDSWRGASTTASGHERLHNGLRGSSRSLRGG